MILSDGGPAPNEFKRRATARREALDSADSRDTSVAGYPDEPLRVANNRMAEAGWTRFPVVSPANPQELLGMVSLIGCCKSTCRS